MSFSASYLVSNFAVQATAAYLQQLRTNELRTKILTAGVLNFISEVLQQHFAGVPRERVSKDASLLTRLLAYFRVTNKAIKMALYGLIVSAPLGHFLVDQVHHAFANQEPHLKHALIGGTSMLVIAPAQIGLLLSARSIFDGAQTRKAVAKDVKSLFVPVLCVTYITLPPAIAFALSRFPAEFEAPFLNFVQFVTATFFNTLGLIASERAKKQTKKDKDQ